MHIVTLTTCHNRRDGTLAALSDLHAQDLPADVTLAHVIVDDGSTDGTAQAVSKLFPNVEIVQGSGHLYWAGGMRHGWEKAVSTKTFDYLFVYNDDVRLAKSAIKELVRSGAALLKPGMEPHVIVGSFLSQNGSVTTYGGRSRSSRWHPLKFAHLVEPDGTLQEADTLNMNGALISRSALSQVGFLSNYFIHSGADFEYGLKLRQAGGTVYVSERHIGRCDLNPETNVLPEHARSLRDSLERLFDRKREPFRQRLNYYRQHGGLLWPAFWITPYITIWFRHLLKRAGGSGQPAGTAKGRQ